MLQTDLTTELVVLSGNEQGKRIPLAGRQHAGKDASCEIRVPSKSAESKHCLFITEGSTVRIRDLGSRSGIFINGKRKHGQVTLKDKDQIGIADHLFQVTIAEHSTSSGSPAAKEQKPVPPPEPVVAKNEAISAEATQTERPLPEQKPTELQRPEVSATGIQPKGVAKPSEPVPVDEQRTAEKKPQTVARKLVRDTAESKAGAIQTQTQESSPSAKEPRIKVACPSCGKTVSAPSRLKGKMGRCKRCGTSFPITDQPIAARSEESKEAARSSVVAFAIAGLLAVAVAYHSHAGIVAKPFNPRSHRLLKSGTVMPHSRIIGVQNACFLPPILLILQYQLSHSVYFPHCVRMFVAWVLPGATFPAWGTHLV